MKVAALQLCSQENVEANLNQAARLVRDAATAGAKLVVLPEAFAFLGPENIKPQVAEELGKGGLIQDSISAWCREHKIAVIAGGLPETSPDPERPYNTSAVFDPSGEVVARYRKVHLFDVELSDGTSWNESARTHPGDRPVVADVLDTQVGLSICYDLRFPQQFTWMVDSGAKVITVPAAFTATTGKAHWHVLLRARAIETQCWVVAAAQEGSHPGNRQTFGHAMIIDPWGEIVAERTDPGIGFALGEIQLERLTSVRAQMPVADHRVKF